MDWLHSTGRRLNEISTKNAPRRFFSKRSGQFSLLVVLFSNHLMQIAVANKLGINKLKVERAVNGEKQSISV